MIKQNELTVNGGTFATKLGRAFMQTEEWLLQAGLGGQLAREGSRWSLVPSARVAYTGMHFGKSGVEGLGPLDLQSGTLGIRSNSKWNATVLSRVGMDIAREGRLLRVPVRVRL